METIYLDNNASTRIAEPVFEAMEPFIREHYGNPSSLHRAGQAARHAVEIARAQVANLIEGRPRDVVFTSGGTEADNLAILGTLAAYPKKRHLVISAVEHVAVHTLAERLAREDYRVSFVAVDAGGALDLDALEAALDDETALASVMLANNETGVLFPISEIAKMTASRGIPLHVDAVQAAGKLELDIHTLGADLLSLSAHKIHGPKGVGALVVGRGARLRNIFSGGHQERDLRPGTHNVIGIVGFGAAAELVGSGIEEFSARVANQRNRLEQGILDRVDRASVIGDPDRRLANTTYIAFEALEAEAILIALSEQGVCASSGSACGSGSLEPSHVLKAMGLDERIAHGAVRFSLSRETTDAEIDRTLEIVPEVVNKLAGLCPATMGTGH